MPKNFKIKNKIFKLLIFVSIFLIINPVNSDSINNSIKINGDPEPTSIEDVKLPEFEYDFNSLRDEFNPENELINLLNNPLELIGLNETDFKQDFVIEK
ncbi:hypothetical protein [Spirobacillus cienkowskii]|jgi:hypothetical protein|uniref:Uncharacterized protein n=1 Tax=Spirobacillus cienkowskii TaxID=495820 RepID=A0A369KUY6_9BACT|nr:MAG: hypothetical protein DCC88_01390 [Spirobacillus cienkowskii]